MVKDIFAIMWLVMKERLQKMNCLYIKVKSPSYDRLNFMILNCPKNCTVNKIFRELCKIKLYLLKNKLRLTFIEIYAYMIWKINDVPSSTASFMNCMIYFERELLGLMEKNMRKFSEEILYSD